MLKQTIDHSINENTIVVKNNMQQSFLFPSDVIYEILSFFDDFKFVVMNCALVSKHWLEIVRDRSVLSLTCYKNDKLQGQFLQSIASLKLLETKRKKPFDCKILGTMNKLTSLNVCQNNIGPEETKLISQMKQLRTLEIRENALNDEAAKEISEMPQLTFLDINWNQNISNEGIRHIFQMKHLTTLIVSGKYGNEFQSISQSTNLTRLEAYNCGIGEEGVKHIAKLAKLTILKIVGNNIGDQGAKCISQLKQLTSLDIGSNHISQIGAKYISELRGLNTLHISRDDVGEAGVIDITNNLPSLTSLSISYINDNQFELICSKLSNLTELLILHNTITEEGAKCIIQLSHLTSLFIRQEENTDEKVKYLNEMKKLTKLNISLNNVPLGCEYIRGMNQLTSLNISNSKNIGSEAIQHLRELVQLKELRIQDCGIDEIGAEYISEMTQLTSLEIGSNNLGALGAKHISEMKQLTHLSIYQNNIGDEGAKYISEMTALKYLHVFGNNITDEGVKFLSKLKRLRTLILAKNDITDEAATTYLSEMDHVVDLVVIRCKISLGSRR